MFVAENETELGRALMKSSSLYFDIQTRERVNAGESFPWEIGKMIKKAIKKACVAAYTSDQRSQYRPALANPCQYLDVKRYSRVCRLTTL